jgi:hypothetical protein
MNPKNKNIGNTWQFVKDNSKTILMLAAGGLGGYYVVTSIPKANAGEMAICVDVDPYDPTRAIGVAFLRHMEGAGEGYGTGDAQDLNPPFKYTNIFSVIPGYELDYDARPPESTTRFKTELETDSAVQNPYNEWLKFHITDHSNLEWKNIFAERYDKDVNMDDSNNLPTHVWDFKKLSSNTSDGWFMAREGSIPHPGIYAQLKITPYNQADLNRDGKVNFIDWAIFARNWQRTGIVKGSDPTNLDDYADIGPNIDSNLDGKFEVYGDGIVDMNDLNLFVNEWLWDSNAVSMLTPSQQMQQLEAVLNSAIKEEYRGKVKVEIANMARVASSSAMLRNNYEGPIQQLTQNNQQSTLRQMLALSESSHNGHLQNSYETIDHELLAKNHNKSFTVPEHLATICNKAPPPS